MALSQKKKKKSPRNAVLKLRIWIWQSLIITAYICFFHAARVRCWSPTLLQRHHTSDCVYITMAATATVIQDDDRFLTLSEAWTQSSFFSFCSRSTHVLLNKSQTWTSWLQLNCYSLWIWGQSSPNKAQNGRRDTWLYQWDIQNITQSMTGQNPCVCLFAFWTQCARQHNCGGSSQRWSGTIWDEQAGFSGLLIIAKPLLFTVVNKLFLCSGSQSTGLRVSFTITFGTTPLCW